MLLLPPYANLSLVGTAKLSWVLLVHLNEQALNDVIILELYEDSVSVIEISPWSLLGVSISGRRPTHIQF